MSYSRDRDAYTRGPGAIAVLDRSPARRARAARAQALSEVRDSELARMTYGSRGGLGAAPSPSTGGRLTVTDVTVADGVIDTGVGSPFKPPSRPPVGPGGKGTPQPPTRGGSITVGGNRTVVGQPYVPSRGSKTQPPPTGPVRGGKSPDYQRGTSVTVISTDPAAGTVTVIDPVTRRPKTVVATSSGGGGGGGSGLPPKTAPTLPGYDPVQPTALPDDDVEDAAPPTTTPSNTKKWLTLAAILGGAYLLLRNSEGS